MKEETKFLEYIKVVAIIISIIFMIGFLYFIINTGGENSLYDLSIEIAGALLVGLIIYFTWNQIQLREQSIKEEETKLLQEAEKKETEDKIKKITQASVTEVHRLNAGLREIDVENVFKVATQFIIECSTIRVIGTAKQNYTELNTLSAITDYLEKTIERVKKSKPLKYRRITSLRTTDNFIEHLATILDNKKSSSSNDFKLMILNDFVPAYTYLIIDEKFIMLTLNYSDQSISTKHYYSQNHVTIQNFIKHFKTVWHEERESNKVIEESSTLKHYFYFRKKTNDYFDRIKRHLNNFSDFPTYSQEHVIEELKQTEHRISGLSSNEIEVHHTIANGSLLRLFCIYLKKLKLNDTYQTLTFRDFWEDIINENRKEPNFVRRNIEALNNGAKITRTLIVKESYAEDEKYSEDITKVIKLNFEILNSCHNPDNYLFRIYFTDKHDYLRRWFYNFALILSEKENGYTEKVIFEPCNNPSYDSTKILFHNDLGSDIHEDEKDQDLHFKFENTEQKLKEIETKWKSQQLSNDHRLFLSKIDNSFFDFTSESEELRKILGEKYFA